MMGLHRIFSTTTVIVGLFIAVDYGLCDEFVCRGYDREHVSDDAGTWKWKTHSIWTGLYVFSLLLFAAFYTLLDRYIAPEYITMPQNVIAPSFLNTISRSVTGSSIRESEIHEQDRASFGQLPVKKSAIHFAMWLHIFLLVVLICTFWVDFIPGVGKGDTVRESFNYTINGILCHFSNHASNKQSTDECPSVFWLAIAFQLAYVTFVLSSVKFLMLCQSAVFTIAAMSSALPVIGVWWSLFYASQEGQLVWSPKIRGEFVCSIIGLPIVFIGLALLCKAHFQDLRRPRYFNSRGTHP